MDRDRSAWLPRAAVESVLIIFSVLLALGLNEWRAESAQRARVAQALDAIRSELEENRRLVAEARAYHTALAASFGQAAKAGAEAPDLDAMTQGLLAPAQVLRAAWESLRHADLAVRVPYDTFLRLSNAYGRQADYETLSYAIGHIAYEQILLHGFDEALRRYPRFIPIQNDFAWREGALIHHYERALEALDTTER
jgi:hypothetical protein